MAGGLPTHKASLRGTHGVLAELGLVLLELAHEARVWVNNSPLPGNKLKGLVERHTLRRYEVGDDDGG